jgi:hypothetical protein
MVEVTVALQLAGSAYNMIKNGVERGREAQDLYEGFTRFFDAKESIAEAAIEARNTSKMKSIFSGKSVEAQALQITEANHRIANIEKELRDFLIYSGQINFYEDMMRERRKIRNARMAAARKKAENKAFWTDILIGVGAVLLAGVVVFGTLVLIT